MDSCDVGSESVDLGANCRRGWLINYLCLVPDGLVSTLHGLVDGLIDHSLLGLLLVVLVGTVGFEGYMLLPLWSSRVIS